MKKIKKFGFKKIKYLDGRRLRNAVYASTRRLATMKTHLNKINVFPVPDGDTGTNMVNTMNHISVKLTTTADKSIAAVSSQLAESALMGAQGNSGAILAQFFHGFAEGVKGKWKLTTATFASAVQNARQAAQEALAEPREGTILTVISDWANYIEKTAKKTEDFVVLLKSGLQKARQSLAETPKKLEVLKKAGVVDAGAQGFVHILEGIVHFIDKGKIEKIINLQLDQESASTAVVLKNVDSDIKFRFCTECMVSATSINHAQLKKALQVLGDSLIVAGSKERVRVHLHTNSPESVLEVISQYGEISGKKIDDMIQQHNEIYLNAEINKIGIVTDSSCDLPYQFIKENHIHFIPLKINFGAEAYLDKVQITPIEFYDKLVTSPHHPTTSQPAMANVLDVYREVAPCYEKILSIHLPRTVSGTFQVVEKAAQTFGENKITCIDGKGISVALGLVVMEAAEAIKEGLPFEQVIQRINWVVNNIKIFITLPTLKYLVKGGRISKPKGLIGRMLRLNPIVSFDKDGRVFLAAKAFGEKGALRKALKMAMKHVRQYKRIKFIVAHANAYSKAEWYVQQLTKVFNVNEAIPIVDAAPVLGVHCGPGTVGFAFVGN